MRTRSNDEWLRELEATGEVQSAALEDLRGYLLRAARYALQQSWHSSISLTPSQVEQLAEDCAQDALLAVLKQLPQFRGDSRFTTWVYKFAVNMALTTVRRESWKQVSLDQLWDDFEWSHYPTADGRDELGPDRAALRDEVWEVVRQTIEQELTDRQRRAIQAIVFDEVPMDEVARVWGTNRNALYKLLHDARRKLKERLEAHGFGVPEILELFRADK